MNGKNEKFDDRRIFNICLQFSRQEKVMTAILILGNLNGDYFFEIVQTALAEINIKAVSLLL